MLLKDEKKDNTNTCFIKAWNLTYMCILNNDTSFDLIWFEFIFLYDSPAQLCHSTVLPMMIICVCVFVRVCVCARFFLGELGLNRQWGGVRLFPSTLFCR